MNQGNEYRAPWLHAVASTPGLTADAQGVAASLADSIIGISDRVFTNWRKLNMCLGRPPGDKAIVGALGELQEAGLLERSHPSGYKLLTPANTGDEE